MLRALIIVAAWAASAAQFRIYPELSPDMHFYLYAAHNPFEFVAAPFSYRVGAPIIVHALTLAGIELFPAFASVTLAFALLNGFLLAHWLDVRGLSRDLATTLVGVFYLTPVGATQSVGWSLTDAPFYSFLLLGLVAIERRNLLGLCAALFVGAAFKENVALLIPYFAVHTWAREGIRAAATRTIPVIAAFATPFFALRFGGPSHLDGFSVTEHLAGLIPHYGGIWRVAANLFSLYTTFWLFALADLDWRKRPEEPLLVALAFAQITFAADIERMVLASFPIIYAMTGRYLMTVPPTARLAAALSPILLMGAFRFGFYYREACLIAMMAALALVSRRYLSRQELRPSPPS